MKKDKPIDVQKLQLITSRVDSLLQLSHILKLLRVDVIVRKVHRQAWEERMCAMSEVMRKSM